MSPVWRAWWGAESRWNLGTGRGWRGSRAPMGAGRPLSRWNTKELNSASIPSQEERRRRRQLAKKLLAQMAFARASPHPGCRIPEGRPLAPHSCLVPSSWTHGSGPDQRGLGSFNQPLPVWLGAVSFTSLSFVSPSAPWRWWGSSGAGEKTQRNTRGHGLSGNPATESSSHDNGHIYHKE